MGAAITVNKLRKRCAHFWRWSAKNPGCMGEQYFCIRYADTKIRPARLSAPSPRPLEGVCGLSASILCAPRADLCLNLLTVGSNSKFQLMASGIVNTRGLSGCSGNPFCRLAAKRLKRKARLVAILETGLLLAMHPGWSQFALRPYKQAEGFGIPEDGGCLPARGGAFGSRI
jgi:hypothetical protein